MTEQATPETPPAPEPTPTPLGRALELLERRAEPKPPAPEAPKVDAAKPDLDLAKAQSATLAKDREARELKKRAAELDARVKAYEGFDSKDPKVIVKLLQERGVKLEDLASGILDDPEDEATVKLRAIEAKLAELQKRESEGVAREVFGKNVAYVAAQLKEAVEKYPLTAAMERAPQAVVHRFNDYVKEHGEAPDLEQLLGEYEAACLADISMIMGSEHALKTLLTRPEIRDRALSVLGVKPSAGPASDKGEQTSERKGAPTAIPKTAAAEAGTRKITPTSLDDRVSAGIALLKQREKAR